MPTTADIHILIFPPDNADWARRARLDNEFHLTFPAGNVTFPAGNGTFPADNARCPAGNETFPAGDGTFPAGNGA